jgi:hypothetical protein
MRNTSKPRSNRRAISPATKIPPKSVDASQNPRPGPPEMFNILLALESARGLLSVRDVAALLRKSSWCIYRLAEQRKIPSLLIGGSRCFDPSVLALWLSKKDPSLAAAARRVKAA